MCAPLVCFLSVVSASTQSHASEPVRFGVLSFRPKPETEARWAPLADYLQTQLNGRPVTLLAFTYPELQEAVGRREVDLVLTQPAHYAALSIQKNLYSPLATLVEVEQGQPMAHFGGVVITRSDHPDIHRLQDLKRRLVATSVRDSLGSFQSQAYELLQLGIRPNDYFIVNKGSNQQLIVDAVLQGRVDAGFVRTGLLEQLSREGLIHLDDLRVIRSTHVDPSFPLTLSTRLYPQWALAAMPWLDEPTARLVAGTILSIPHGHEVTTAARISGFTIPGDYHTVAHVMRSLRTPPFDERVPLEIIWEDYRALWVAVLFLVTATGFGLGRHLITLNRQKRASRLQMQEAASVFEHVSEAIMITNHAGVIVDVNAAFTRITGYSREESVGQNPRFLSSGRHDKVFYQSLWDTLTTCGEWTGELWNRRKSGEIYPERLTINAVRRPDGQVVRYIGVFADITDIKNRESVLQRHAHYDMLTGLPNRLMLHQRLQHATMQSERRRLRLAVLYIDIDGFKQVNDTHGHAVGDQLLEQLARRMENVLREGDTLARLGGDEFVALLSDLSSLSEVEPIVRRLIGTVAEPVLVDNTEIRVSASIGIAFSPHTEVTTPELLLQQADEAMYMAKQQGKNRYHMVDPGNDLHHP